MAKQDAFPKNTGDWLKDPNLSMCGPATRGIWEDLLCAMHELNRSGLITGTATQLSRTSRCTVVEFENAIAELRLTKTANVTERESNGEIVYTIINRRMKRESDDREAARIRAEKSRRSKAGAEACGNVTQMSRKSAEKSRQKCANVTDENSPVNRLNSEDKEGAADSSHDCHANVTPYAYACASSSPVLNKEESNRSREKKKKATTTSTPTSLNPSKPNGKDPPLKETQEEYLNRKQRERPEIDVHTLFKRFCSYCRDEGSKPTRPRFDVWVESEPVPMEIPSEILVDEDCGSYTRDPYTGAEFV